LNFSNDRLEQLMANTLTAKPRRNIDSDDFGDMVGLSAGEKDSNRRDLPDGSPP